MKGQRKLWLANGMKWRENSVLFFWKLLVVFWNERNFSKSLRFPLVSLPNTAESYFCISNKITFVATRISETFFWFMLLGFFCLFSLYFAYWMGSLVCFFGFFPSIYHSAVFLIFLSSFHSSSWAGKQVLNINVISQFLRCWAQTLCLRAL